MKDIIYHNSHDIAYRNPFGAIERNKMLSIAVFSIYKHCSKRSIFEYYKKGAKDVLK